MATLAAMDSNSRWPHLAAVYSNQPLADRAAMSHQPLNEDARNLVAHLERQDRNRVLASLPFAMAEVAGHHGFEAAVALVMNFGGKRIHVPVKPEGKKLAQVIGDDAARTLAKHYGGTHMTVPTAGTFRRAALQNKRDEAVMVRLLAGESQEQIAFDIGVCRTTIQRIVTRYRAAGDARLLALDEARKNVGDPKARRRAARNDEIIRRRRAGESPRDLAAAFELSPKWISAIIANHKRNGDGR